MEYDMLWEGIMKKTFL